jgi:hypothetical protein
MLNDIPRFIQKRLAVDLDLALYYSVLTFLNKKTLLASACIVCMPTTGCLSCHKRISCFHKAYVHYEYPFCLFRS